jgi:hypothetical protein
VSDDDDDLGDDPTRNYHGGNPESNEAFESIKGRQRRLDLRRVVEFVGSRLQGSTCDEAEVALGLSHQTCSARFTDAKRKELIFVTDQRRRTRHGRPAKVCVCEPPPLDWPALWEIGRPK